MVDRVAIGNDLVDLDDPDTFDRHRDPRFVARVLSEAERQALAESGDPRRLLWCFFAAKEAAYKALVKLGQRPGFAHRKLEVAADLTSVRYADLSLRLWMAPDPGWVHAVASSAEHARWSSGVARLSPGGDPSADARALLARTLAPELGVRAEALGVVRQPEAGSWDGFGPPVLHLDGQPLAGADLSLSHHGQLVAFAASL